MITVDCGVDMAKDIHVPAIMPTIIRASVNGVPRQTFLPSDTSLLASPQARLNDTCINGCATLLYSAFMLLLVVRFSQPMISLASTSMLMTTCSGAMSHGHTSGRSQSGSFRSIIHYLWDTGSFVLLIFPLENCYFLIVLPNRSLGKTKLRSVTFAS